MTDLCKSKEVELRHKLDSLTEEFKHWRSDSEEGRPLAKHNTQIRRITDELSEVVKRVQSELANAAQPGQSGPTSLLSQGRDLQKMILELHHIWDYFRSKLALRYVPVLHDYLEAADELAFACYEPAQRLLMNHNQAAAERTKAPPLVYLTGMFSPFITPRDMQFAAAMIAPGESQQRKYFKEVLKQLPIPVLGVPWYQVSHLADALVIGHEVGHLVEEDCGLTEILRDAIKAAVPATHQAAWLAWIGELFADLYACLALGPAFVSSLLGFLAQAPEQIQKAVKPTEKGWGDYPTDALRIHFNVQVIKERQFGDEAEQILKDWQAIYPAHAMPAYEKDIPDLVKQLLNTPLLKLGGTTIGKLIEFSPEDLKEARRDADDVIKGKGASRGNTPGKAVRLRFISAALALESDLAMYEQRAHRSLLKALLKQRDNRVRAGTSGATKTPAPQVVNRLYATLLAAAQESESAG